MTNMDNNQTDKEKELQENMDELLKLDLFEALGITDATDEEKREFLDEGTTIIFARVAEIIKEELQEDANPEFERLFIHHTGTQEEKESFLKTHVPDFDKLVLTETMRFKIELIQAAQEEQDVK